MKDENKTKAQLIFELAELRKKLAAQQKINETKITGRIEIKGKASNLEILFDQSPIEVIAYQDDKIVYANQASIKGSGFDNAAEVIGKQLEDFVVVEQFEMLSQRKDQFLAGKQNPPAHYKVKRKDGVSRWLEVNSVAVLINGKPAILTFGYDITDQKEAQQALKESEARFRLQFDSNPIPTTIWEYKENTFYLIDSNQAANKISNDRIPSSIGRPAEEIFSNRPDLIGRFQQCIKDKKTIYYASDFQMQRISYDLYINFTFVYISPNLVMLHTEDITERNEAEQALRESEEKYHLLFDTSTMGIGYNDTEGRIISFNRVAAERLGGKPEDFIGKTMLELLPDGGEIVHERLIKTVRTGKTYQYEDLVPLPIGEKWFKTIYSSVKNDDQEVIGVQVISQDITERKQAEQALRESEEKYRLLFDTSTMGIGYNDIAGKIISFNRVAAGRLGGKPEDFIGKTMLELLPDGGEIYHERLIKTVHTGQTYRYEDLVPLPIGEKWFRSIYSSVKNDDQEVIGVQVISQDITEQKKAELALKKSEHKYHTLFENMAQGAFYQRADGVLVDVNPAALDIFELTRDQFLGKTSYDPQWVVVDKEGNLLPPDKHPSMLTLASGEPIEDLIAVKSLKTNQYKWIFVNAKPQFGEDKQHPDHVFVTMHDITSRIEAEERLQESESRYRLIADNIEDVIWLMDEKFRYIFISPSIQKLLGYTPEEFKFIHFKDIMAQDSLQVIQKAIEGRVEAEKAGIGDNQRRFWELQYLNKDGNLVWIESVTQPVRNENGKFTGMIGTLRNIEERKKAEAIIQLHQDRLKTLTQRLFTLQEEERQRISRDLHDETGQALSVVKIYLNMLKNKTEEHCPQLLEDLEKVNSALDTAHSQIRELAFSLRPSTLDLLGLPKAVQKLCQRIGKEISLKIELETDELPPLPDKAAIALYRITQEALNNILAHANATKINIKIKHIDSTIQIRIKDDGVGFINETMDDDNIGLGILGMRERINAVNGTLEISTGPQKGTTLTATYPIEA